MRGMKERWCFVHVGILGRGIEDDMGGMLERSSRDWDAAISWRWRVEQVAYDNLSRCLSRERSGL